MATAAQPRDPLMPPPPEGLRRPLLLALGAHGLLLIGLAIGVNWHASEPEGVQAELWAAVPQVSGTRVDATPPPPPPPRVANKPAPTPPKQADDERPTRDAQIAIERDKARKEREKKTLEKEKQELERLKKLQAEQATKQQAKQREDDKKKSDKTRAAEAEKMAAKADADREKNLQDIIRKAAGTSGSGQAAQTSGPSASYGGRIKAAVRPNITFVREISGNPTAEVEVRASPDGAIIGSKIIKSSGVAAWDEAVLNAIEKTAKFPRDENGRVPSPMILSFRPNDL